MGGDLFASCGRKWGREGRWEVEEFPNRTGPESQHALVVGQSVHGVFDDSRSPGGQGAA